MNDTTKKNSVLGSALNHLVSALLVTILSVAVLGFGYPYAIYWIGQAAFPKQANGSLIVAGGKLIGSDILGQIFSKPQYFHPRPSAAGKNGYDPTSTGATNLAPTSKKLYDATKATVAALRKENPDATGPIPADLVTSSASGTDPDISPEGAYYQIPRIAKARNMTHLAVAAIVDAHVHARSLGFLGEPHVNVLELNRALDGAK
jgi:K+-transporting ATPase ATPase C chain